MTNVSRLRLVVLSALVLSLVATLLGRLWYLQVLAAPTYRAAAADLNVKDIVTEAPRGEIVDDKGRPFIDNKTALVISVDRVALQRQSDGGKAVLARLAGVLGTSYASINQKIQLCGTPLPGGGHVGQPCWNGSPYQPIPVSQLKPDTRTTRQALQILEMHERFPGVSVQLAAVRHYPKPAGALASQVLGYIQPISQAALSKLSGQQQQIQRSTQVGATGLEAAYEKYLHGKPGIKQVAVDHVGAVTGTIKDTPAVPGDTVVTNLDAQVQATLESQLQARVADARSHGQVADYAAGVVLNVRTGGVVAMASYPTYQPDIFVGGIKAKTYKRLQHATGHPLVDKAYQSTNPPGSSFKLISASGLVNDGTTTINAPVDCSASFFGKHNFEGEVGGVESLHEAIVQSCDTVFYRLAYNDWKRDDALVKQHKKPVEGVQRVAHAYGIAEPPGIDLPNAATGHIADRYNTKLAWQQNKSNYCKGAKTRPKGSYFQKLDAEYCATGYLFEPGDQMNEDIGQGTVLVSPLQLAVAYAAMANGGTVYKPRVAKAILSPAGKLIKRVKAPVRDHLPVAQSTLDYIRSAMYGVTSEARGTGAGVYAGWPMNKVLVGGKTGTAELGANAQYDGSWFASFAGPAGGKPQYVAVIEVDKASQGAISAAPATRVIWSHIYGVGGPKPIFPGGLPPAKLPVVGAAHVAPPTHRRSQHRHGGHRSGATSAAGRSPAGSQT